MSKLTSLEAVAADRRHLLHPHLEPGHDQRTHVVRGEGCTVWTSDGEELLDATGGGLWANVVGCGRTELADAARTAMADLGFFCSFWDYGNPAAAELGEKLAEISPNGLERVLLTSGGSESIELAIKAARRFHFLRGATERTWVLGRRNSYHGMGHGGSSATDFAWLREGYGPELPDFRLLSPAWAYHSELYGGRSVTDFAVAELEEAIEEIGPERVAAFIGEPIAGVGGLLVPPDDYWPRIAEVLRRHGILLIFDEVVTGFGRLGSWFAADHFGVEPDLMVCAKGISSGYFPVGGILFREDIGATLASGPHGIQLGYTYGGHPAGAAVALANIAIIEREDLVGRAATVGALLHEGLRELERHDIVGDVRGIGLVAGIELVSDPDRRTGIENLGAVTQYLRHEHSLIVRAAMNSSLVLSPSLVITEAEIERLVGALSETLAKTDKEGRVGALPVPTSA